VAAEAVGVETCKIALASPPYKETFASPSEFRQGVTPEALRDCKRISVAAHGCELRVHVRFRLDSIGSGSPPLFTDERAGVLLYVRSSKGVDDPRLARVTRKVRAAIERGTVSKVRDLVARSLIVASTVVVLVATVWSLQVLSPYLDDLAQEKLGIRNISHKLFQGTEPVVGYVFLVLTAYAAQLLRPRVEVAPLGHTRLLRVAKLVGPWFAGIVAAGLVKVVFG
jgi:hypothetical protein